MIRGGLLAGVFGLAGCSTLVDLPDGPAPTSAHAWRAWAQVLDTHVNALGEVDFEALAANPAALSDVVRYIAATPLEDLRPPQARLAHMINAYNALSMFNVLASGIPRTHAGLNKVVFFVQRKLRIGGQAMSLYTFENEVIRPLARSMGLPEVHFALNCSAVSCPVLPRQPFSAEGLRDELAREARRFFSNPANFRVDVATRTVWLSEILSFYTVDFVPDHGHSLIAYANRHSPTPAPESYSVRFTPYDWTVANSKRPRQPAVN